MTINTQYSLREVAGEKVIIQQGKQGVDMTKIISLNSSAEFLWNKFFDKSFTEEDVAEALVTEYGISETTASSDAHKWCGQMREINLILD